MKRVIRFSSARYLFFGFSAVLILIGVGGFIANRGLNLGVDFKAGMALQFQVAPASFTVQYDGPDAAKVELPAGEQALTSPGDIIFTITSAKDGSKAAFPFSYKDYAAVRELADAIGATVDGLTVTVMGDPSAVPTDLLPLPRPADIKGTPVTINLSPAPGRGEETSLSEMRALLAPLGEISLQSVGATAKQEFIARVPVSSESSQALFQDETQSAVVSILEAKYGAGQIILKSTEFVGPRLAQSLATQTIWLVLITIVLILVYMVIRFHPWIYGVAAVLGIMHDAFVMLSFDAVFKVEIDAGTIAAILTILGYSINDTIVNFDRARENNNLMRGESLRTILDTSVTQNLSRTFITSGATLLTIVALFILTTGTIRNFALNMIVGIVEGTYSTFISAFIVIEWITWTEKRRKAGELAKYGIGSGSVPAGAPTAAREAATADEAEEEPENVPGALEPEAALETAGSRSAPDAVSSAPVAAGTPQPAGQPTAFPGQQGSRKHKKHRRRHH